MSIETAACDLIAVIGDACPNHVAILRAALDAADGYTICIQEEHSTDTTHVTFQKAATVEAAVVAAMEECRSDWGDYASCDCEDACDCESVPRDLYVFAVMRGNVDIIEWNDQ